MKLAYQKSSNEKRWMSNWEEWVAYRKENKLPHPPLFKNEVKYAGVYWLGFYPSETGSADAPSLTIKQWNPIDELWYNVNEIAIGAEGQTMEGWHVICEIPQIFAPPLENLLKKNEDQRAY